MDKQILVLTYYGLSNRKISEHFRLKYHEVINKVKALEVKYKLVRAQPGQLANHILNIHSLLESMYLQDEYDNQKTFEDFQTFAHQYFFINKTNLEIFSMPSAAAKSKQALSAETKKAIRILFFHRLSTRDIANALSIPYHKVYTETQIIRAIYNPAQLTAKQLVDRLLFADSLPAIASVDSLLEESRN